MSFDIEKRTVLVTGGRRGIGLGIARAFASAAYPRSILNITSVSAAASSPERLDYCISKTGLAAFSQGLALRLAESGISVFKVRPGIIRTDMTAGVTDRYDSLIENGLVPMKRLGGGVRSRAHLHRAGIRRLRLCDRHVIDADGGLSIPRL